jgi:hypothetical protein
MNYYSIALFLHVVGALGLFVAMGLEWVGLQQLQAVTTTEQVRERLRGSTGVRAIGGISILVLLAAGFYMTATAWGGVAWISLAFGALIVMGALGGILTSPRMAAIKRAVATENGPISPALSRLLHHPLLWISMQTRIGIALGIVFLMCVKPTLMASLLALGVATLLGLGLALSTMGRRRMQTVGA